MNRKPPPQKYTNKTCKRADCGLAVPPYRRAKPINLPSNATGASRGRPPAFFETLARPSTLISVLLLNYILVLLLLTHFMNCFGLSGIGLSGKEMAKIFLDRPRGADNRRLTGSDKKESSVNYM